MKKSPMNILHLTPSYKPAWVYGGPTVSVSQLAAWQVKAGCRVTVLTTGANGAGDFPVADFVDDDGVRVIRKRRITGDHTHFSPGLIWTLIRISGQFDVIHLHSWWNLVALPAAAVLSLKKGNFVFSPRGMFSTYTISSRARNWFHFNAAPALLRRFRFHATSRAEASEISRILPNASIRILPNYIPLPDSVLKENRGFSPMKFLFYSRIHDKKGLELTFSCLAELKDLPWNLTIAGDGEPDYCARLKDLAASLGLSGRITWTGFISAEGKQDLFMNSGVMILLSKNENFGNSVIESLAFGVPVLVSDQVGAGEWVSGSNWGWVVPLEKDKIVETLRDIISSEAALHLISQRAPAEVQAQFNSTRLAQDYLDFYSE